jgi:hypothetical protein
MIDWTKPIEWVNAHADYHQGPPSVLRVYPEGCAALEYYMNDLPHVFVAPLDYPGIRNVPSQPRELWVVFGRGDFVHVMRSEEAARRLAIPDIQEIVHMREVQS